MTRYAKSAASKGPSRYQLNRCNPSTSAFVLHRSKSLDYSPKKWYSLPITCEGEANDMSVQLHFNDRRGEVAPGASLFDYADTLGIKVPTSCRKQGKCKECLVEI